MTVGISIKHGQAAIDSFSSAAGRLGEWVQAERHSGQPRDLTALAQAARAATEEIVEGQRSLVQAGFQESWAATVQAEAAANSVAKLYGGAKSGISPALDDVTSIKVHIDQVTGYTRQAVAGERAGDLLDTLRRAG